MCSHINKSVENINEKIGYKAPFIEAFREFNDTISVQLIKTEIGVAVDRDLVYKYLGILSVFSPM